MKQHKIAIIGYTSFVAKNIIETFSDTFYIVGYGRKKIKEIEIDEYRKFDFFSSKLDFKELLQFDLIIYCAGGGIQANLHYGREVI